MNENENKYLDYNGLSTLVSEIKDRFPLKTDLNAKQDLLVSGTNIKTLNNNSLLGSGDISIVSATPFPAGFDTNHTTQDFLDSIENLNLPVGMTYLGQVSLSDMPDGVSVQAEVEVYVYPQNVIYCVMRSAEVKPYTWECNSYDFRGWEGIDKTANEHTDAGLAMKQDELISGTNIKTINNQSILGSGNLTIDTSQLKGISIDIAATFDYPLDLGTAEAGIYIDKNGKSNVLHFNYPKSGWGTLTINPEFIIYKKYSDCANGDIFARFEEANTSPSYYYLKKSTSSGTGVNYMQIMDAPLYSGKDTNVNAQYTFSYLPKSSATPTDTQHLVTKAWVDNETAAKQDFLVSGVNIKSINNTSILGSGNLSLPTDTSELTNGAGFITKDVNDLTYYTLATETGSSIDLSINSTTYVMTLDLKDSSGTTISTDSIDLPLESMVVNATYDSQNKKIVLTLQSGATIDVPVADLVSGLQTEITANNKLSADLVDDTNTTNKFVTTSEKTTWNNKSDFSGDYTDLTNKPTNVSDFNNDAGYTTNIGTITSVKMNGSTISSSGEADLGTVITDVSNKQDVIDGSNKLSADYIDDTNTTNKLTNATEKTTWNGKQDALVSGTNIKTINNMSVLGSGNLELGADFEVATSSDIKNIITRRPKSFNIDLTDGNWSGSSPEWYTEDTDIEDTFSECTYYYEDEGEFPCNISLDGETTISGIGTIVDYETVNFHEEGEQTSYTIEAKDIEISGEYYYAIVLTYVGGE